MVHLAAMSLAYHDILEEAQNAPDGSEHTEPTTPSTSDSSDSEFEIGWLSNNEYDTKKEKLNTSRGYADESYRLNGARRFSSFILCTQSEGQDDSLTTPF